MSERAPVHAFRGARPRRIPASFWELADQGPGADGRTHYVLRNRVNDAYLFMDEHGRAAWGLMDGRHTIMEIAGALFLRHGSFDPASFQSLLAELGAAGFLVRRRWYRWRAALARRRSRALAVAVRLIDGLDRCTVRLTGVDRGLTRFHRLGGWVLTTPAALVTALVVTAAAVPAFVTATGRSSRVLEAAWTRPGLTVALVAVALVPGMALHELAHALACTRFRRRVGEFGFTLLHGFVPIFYADVSDIFMASRRARILVSLAGPLTNLVLGAAAFFAAGAASGYVRSVLVVLGVVQWELALLNLYPFTFVALDGYHVLSDWLGLPALRVAAWRFVRGELPARVAAREALQRHEWIYVAYVALSAASLLLYAAAHARPLVAVLAR